MGLSMRLNSVLEVTHRTCIPWAGRALRVFQKDAGNSFSSSNLQSTIRSIQRYAFSLWTCQKEQQTQASQYQALALARHKLPLASALHCQELRIWSPNSFMTKLGQSRTYRGHCEGSRVLTVSLWRDNCICERRELYSSIRMSGITKQERQLHLSKAVCAGCRAH